MVTSLFSKVMLSSTLLCHTFRSATCTVILKKRIKWWRVIMAGSTCRFKLYAILLTFTITPNSYYLFAIHNVKTMSYGCQNNVVCVLGSTFVQERDQPSFISYFLILFYFIHWMFAQDRLFNSNELLLTRVSPSLQNIYKEAHVISNFYHRMPHGEDQTGDLWILSWLY